MAAGNNSRLQQMLQSAVQAVQWTYSLFWQVCPQQGILVWGDGYYNGAIKTRKTVQPMEVTAEEASLHRSQQLRELYDSLSAEETNQPVRRPCAALSPEDLTESSGSTSCLLPGKAFARQHHIWLLGANEADSKVFSRAILAKSAVVQTVVCIPLMDGVVELGTTDRVQEDLSLIQHIKSFFIDQHLHHHNPAHSEHSTSNPTTATSGNTLFHSPQPALIYSAAHPPTNTTTTTTTVDDEEEDDEEEDDEEDDAAESDSVVETGHRSASVAHHVPMTHANAGPSELMQLDMSEDIRLGSPDDGSNNLDSDLHMVVANQSTGPSGSTRRRWASLPDNSLQPPVSSVPTQSRPPIQGPTVIESHSCNDNSAPLNKTNSNLFIPTEALHQIEELTEEDAHYSQTVSTILQQTSTRLPESSSASVDFIAFSPHSAFSKPTDHRPPMGTGAIAPSQYILKCILFNVPFLHHNTNNKYIASRSDDASPRSRGEVEPEPAASRLRKCGSNDELSANHVLAERRRREKLNERFIILRSLVPFVTKMDKASILGDTIEYVKQLRNRVQDLESRSTQIDGDQRSGEVGGINAGVDDVFGSGRRKMRGVEGSGGGIVKVVEGAPLVGNVVQVSIIESDALLELKCVYREGILLEVMQTLRELRMEITAINSSSSNGVFGAELRAKVKESNGGRKTTIVEVKRAVHQIISQF
ncbi:hypothetical protein Syun_007576 [Stephania yunnanensis]|uniref:BHLH domain-containing protein n=1 Tax=Stephania yunnanensis TaxID=152371 RepID=A0AAP0L1B4_9MAGN